MHISIAKSAMEILHGEDRYKKYIDLQKTQNRILKIINKNKFKQEQSQNLRQLFAYEYNQFKNVYLISEQNQK